MNRRWIVVAIVVVAVIGIANIFILMVLVPRWSKATTSAPPAPAPAATAVALAPPPASASNLVATSKPLPVAHHPPARPPVQAGMRLERQVLTPSGNLRIEYMRDRQQGIRQIVVRDSRNPTDSTVLSQYKRNAWVVVSPDDQWIVLNSREGGANGAQLYQRVSSAPLKYEIPEELRANDGGLQDVVWENYLAETQQDPNTDRSHVTIDGIAWEPDSHKISLSVAPIATRNDVALPEPWSCAYDVTTKQIDPPEVAEGPPDGSANAAPNDATGAPPENVAATDNTSAAPAGDQGTELEGEKFPATREETVTVSDVNELDLSDIRYAIFEMFARHGADMHDAKMKKVFSGFPWYQPRPDVSFDDIEAEFSDLEKQNLAVLRRCRDAKVASAARHSEPKPKPIRGERVEEESNGERILKGVLQGVSDALNGGNP